MYSLALKNLRGVLLLLLCLPLLVVAAAVRVAVVVGRVAAEGEASISIMAGVCVELDRRPLSTSSMLTFEASRVVSILRE